MFVSPLTGSVRWQRRASLACAVTALVWPAVARGSCQVELIGPEARAWSHAVEELEQDLSARESGEGCPRLRLEAFPQRVELTFVASDGRRATRQLIDPIELAPTVDALSVSVPALQAEAPDTTQRANKPSTQNAAPRSSPRSPLPDQASASAIPKAGPYDLKPLFGAEVGARGGADHLISPCLGIFVGFPLQGWEVGVLGRYEAHYVSTLGGNEGAPDTSSVAFGVSAGLRRPLGAFVWRAGLTGLVAALLEQDGSKDGRAQPRLGAYLGGVWPGRSRFALRFSTAIEVVPGGRGRSNQNGDPSIPWWAVISTVGLEFN